MATPGASVVIKSGCPYSCSYCDAYKSMGRRFKLRKPDEIVYDIKDIKRIHKARRFFFIDPCFNSPMDYAQVYNQGELLFPKFYVSKNIDIEWSNSYIKKESAKYNYRLRRMAPIGASMLLERIIPW